MRPTETVLVLAYKAEGRRGEAPGYVAHCTSTYRLAHDVWRLIQHQQAPA